jgi:hypothetical protein
MCKETEPDLSPNFEQCIKFQALTNFSKSTYELKPFCFLYLPSQAHGLFILKQPVANTGSTASVYFMKNTRLSEMQHMCKVKRQKKKVK